MKFRGHLCISYTLLIFVSNNYRFNFFHCVFRSGYVQLAGEVASLHKKKLMNQGPQMSIFYKEILHQRFHTYSESYE